MTSTNTNSVLVGVEDTTPQNQQFDTVREFDENEEGFIDVDVNDNVWSDQTSDDYQNSMVQELDNIGEDQGGENDEKELQQLGMSPLLDKVNNDINHEEGNVIHSEMDEPMSSQLEANDNNNINDLPPPSPASSSKSILPRQAMQIMRSRRVKSGDISDYDDGDNDKHRKRFSCLKKKRSRDGGEYERIDNTQYTGLDASTNSRTGSETSTVSGGAAAAMGCGKMRRFCQESSKQVLRTTVSVMNFLAKVLLWGSFVAMIIGVVWYSRELKNRGHEAHLIAWFSAGAFVLLGFPISMCGIIMHLKNYYQPNVQCYVVRILWMVPIYSIESWLCLRFHELAIYIETLRDVYESYVLYSFFQFLIEVLGGEEALVLMLKDKSPTRGAHIWGLGYCIKPWAMGQPVSRRVSYTPDKMARMGHNNSFAANNNNGGQNNGPMSSRGVPIKKVEWMSPFFVKCKFGVLQYVLLKFVSSIFVMVLEMNGLYKEGDFTPRGGYLYICILTNLSQCWALYCLVLFYYALKNELGPIRPIGKFLSVKALVFFTWWQSLGISILFQVGMIPNYTAFSTGRDWSSDDVAKGLQDWLICIEMFCFAIIHTFVFPHTDYLKPLGVMKQRADMTPHGVRRLGRKGRHGYRRGDDRSTCSKSSGEHELGGFDLELGSCDTVGLSKTSTVDEQTDKDGTDNGGIATGIDETPRHERQGFVRALVDSTLPRDVLDESVGIFKGKYNDEKKTLLHHAATSDEYDLFSKSSKRRKAKFSRTRQQGGAVPSSRKMKDGASAGVPNSVLLND